MHAQIKQTTPTHLHTCFYCIRPAEHTENMSVLIVRDDTWAYSRALLQEFLVSRVKKRRLKFTCANWQLVHCCENSRAVELVRAHCAHSFYFSVKGPISRKGLSTMLWDIYEQNKLWKSHFLPHPCQQGCFTALQASKNTQELFLVHSKQRIKL